MASKRIQEVIDRFVEELMVVCEQEAVETIQNRLRDAFGPNVAVQASAPAAPPAAKRRRSTKGYSVLRPCPIPGCKDPETGEPRIAAPRHGMVCKFHSDLPREEILLARDNAAKEGGIWFDLKPVKVKKTA